MSTLAAVQADGFYYPPDWTPEGGAKNSAYKGSNGSLGKRANKLSQGVLTIRFEMPFNVKCGACGHMIAKGVRFNAEKRKIGKYHSTPIWSFTMHSACCSQEIEVQTDPAKTEYNVTKGAERCVGYGGAMDDEESPEDAMQMLEYQNEEERAKFLANPIAVLERGVEDEKRARARARTTFELNALSKARWKEDYDVNKSLRRSMRGRRKEEHALRDHARALGLPEHVKLEPERDEDKEYARRVFNASVFERNRKQKRKDILSESIFADKRTRPKPAAKRTSSASSNHSRAAKLAKRR
ncbi:predicted protein [Ostreococcus lucimarinus CCE9901]|uniref:CWC16 protein n=1 Tax=Ostreococcus lucimarinus (strain CCE9901) TaxID=436017 RepID=A4S9J3_OSTLU|nr:predicted protein [Ostreococcus lucimarinus CCE9901]ABP00497.1 predicted protein [Ostreococcus lucimarinus CCE9901]|eukprot:XP_001422180.1 predicted protein [Ostreococcus lucimarinus CCE9901]